MRRLSTVAEDGHRARERRRLSGEPREAEPHRPSHRLRADLLHVRRFFRDISLLWAFAQAANASITIWLLFSQSVGTFVVLRTVVSLGVTTLGIVASCLWFRRSMARHDISVTLRRRAVAE